MKPFFHFDFFFFSFGKEKNLKKNGCNALCFFFFFFLNKKNQNIVGFSKKNGFFNKKRECNIEEEEKGRLPKHGWGVGRSIRHEQKSHKMEGSVYNIIIIFSVQRQKKWKGRADWPDFGLLSMVIMSDQTCR